MKIIFVCMGNTCRSPMAEGILKSMGEDLQVESRGIHIIPGTRTNIYTQTLLKERLKIDLNRPAIQLTEEDCRSTDLMLTMTRAQADFVRNLTGCSDVYSLSEFADATGDVADPYGQSKAAYEATFDQLKELIGLALQNIRNEQNR